MLNDVEFREVQEVAVVDKVKIVACDGKSKLKDQKTKIFTNFILFLYLNLTGMDADGAKR